MLATGYSQNHHFKGCCSDLFRPSGGTSATASGFRAVLGSATPFQRQELRAQVGTPGSQSWSGLPNSWTQKNNTFRRCFPVWKITILEVPWIFSDTFAGDFEDGLNHPKLAETPNSMSSEGSHTEIWCKTSNLCRTLYTMSLCFLIIGWSLKCHPFLKHHLNCLGLGQIWVPKRCFFHKKWTKIISTHSHLYLRVS